MLYIEAYFTIRSIVMISVVILSIITLMVILLSVVVLNVIMVSDIMLTIIIVVAPLKTSSYTAKYINFIFVLKTRI